MTESQFAYATFTLDELRSLAASPQVGTMQAMPQSFRALADRVGEVADLLSHAQADLPNWWKGPAAEQAAATLGRAVAEAREFHDSATGAATAVSRCAQVVAEQQNQMMNVPDVQEPGVSAVVQRPTTPFEALEAARHDAAYQAAHEQAVQVVNGIAAQYVETRAALSTISAAKGENFVSVPAAPPRGTMAWPLASELSDANLKTANTVELNQLNPNSHTTEGMNTRERFIPTELTNTRTESSLYSRTESREAPSIASPHSTSSSKFEGASSPKSTEKLASFESTAGPHQPLSSVAAPNAEPEPPVASSRQPATEMAVPVHTQIENNPISDTPGSPYYEQPHTSTSAAPSQKPVRKRLTDQRLAKNFELEDVGALGITSPSTQLSSQHSDHLQVDGSSGDNTSAAIIPPYGGVGSVRRTGDERNPRPAYLKERKSVWLPDTVAAPADGILTPEWFALP